MAGVDDSKRSRGSKASAGAVLLAAVLVIAGWPATGAEVAPATHDDDGLEVFVDVEPERPFVDENVLTGVYVENERNDTLGNVTVSIELDGSPVHNVSVGVLTPGENVFIEHNLSTLDADRHTVVAVAEGTTPPNATNGTTVQGIGGQYLLVTERDRSDLEPLEPVVEPAYRETVFDQTQEIVDGEFAEVFWSVRNVGEGYSERSEAELRLDGEIIDRAEFPRLDPRDGDVVIEPSHSQFGQRAFLQAEAGEHDLTVAADSDEEVTELDESNNLRTETLKVLPKANPAVGAIEAERANLTVAGEEGPTNPYAERDVTVTLTNEADGRTAAPFEVEAEVCAESGVLSADVPLFAEPNECEPLEEWHVQEYGAGETVDLETEWDPVGHAGDQEICVQFEYQRPQTSETDDRDCQDTSVIVGNTGLGGR